MSKLKNMLKNENGQVIGKLQNVTKSQISTWLEEVEFKESGVEDFIESLLGKRTLVQQVKVYGTRYIELFGSWGDLNTSQQSFIEKKSTEYTRPARSSGYYAWFETTNYFSLEKFSEIELENRMKKIDKLIEKSIAEGGRIPPVAVSFDSRSIDIIIDSLDLNAEKVEANPKDFARVLADMITTGFPEDIEEKGYLYLDGFQEDLVPFADWE